MIFISYRREDSKNLAYLLADKLAARYGPAAVFLDREQIGLGEDWRERIDDALQRSKIVFALIGPRWLSEADEWGRRRIDLDDDVLAYELSRADNDGKKVIPLYLDGREPLPLQALPPRLSFLSKPQGIPFEIPRDLPKIYDAIESMGILPSNGVQEGRKEPKIRHRVSLPRFRERARRLGGTESWPHLTRRAGPGAST